MSAPKPDGRPALPADLSLRDWFAGQALASVLSGPRNLPNGDPACAKRMAEGCYLLADAMLKARGE